MVEQRSDTIDTTKQKPVGPWASECPKNGHPRGLFVDTHSWALVGNIRYSLMGTRGRPWALTRGRPWASVGTSSAGTPVGTPVGVHVGMSVDVDGHVVGMSVGVPVGAVGDRGWWASMGVRADIRGRAHGWMSVRWCPSGGRLWASMCMCVEKPLSVGTSVRGHARPLARPSCPQAHRRWTPIHGYVNGHNISVGGVCPWGAFMDAHRHTHPGRPRARPKNIKQIVCVATRTRRATTRHRWIPFIVGGALSTFHGIPASSIVLHHLLHDLSLKKTAASFVRHCSRWWYNAHTYQQLIRDN